MIDLYKYITETIFDDDKQIDSINTNAWKKLFADHSSWYIGKDNKTIFDIVFDDIDWQRLDMPNPHTDKDWIESLVKYDLKFQPLPHLDMHIGKKQDIDLLNIIPVDTVVGLQLSVENESVVVDLSNIKFNITNSINLKINDDITHSNIIPYGKRVSKVSFGTWRGETALSIDCIKGWDCEELVVPSRMFGPRTEYVTDITSIQKLIDNNPKVKDFYVWDNNQRKYMKVKTNSKRQFDKYIVRQPKSNNERYKELNKVCDWINSHKDIFPFDVKKARRKKVHGY